MYNDHQTMHICAAGTSAQAVQRGSRGLLMADIPEPSRALDALRELSSGLNQNALRKLASTWKVPHRAGRENKTAWCTQYKSSPRAESCSRYAATSALVHIAHSLATPLCTNELVTEKQCREGEVSRD